MQRLPSVMDDEELGTSEYGLLLQLRGIISERIRSSNVPTGSSASRSMMAVVDWHDVEEAITNENIPIEEQHEILNRSVQIVSYFERAGTRTVFKRLMLVLALIITGLFAYSSNAHLLLDSWTNSLTSSAMYLPTGNDDHVALANVSLFENAADSVFLLFQQVLDHVSVISPVEMSPTELEAYRDHNHDHSVMFLGDEVIEPFFRQMDVYLYDPVYHSTLRAALPILILIGMCGIPPLVRHLRHIANYDFTQDFDNEDLIHP